MCEAQQQDGNRVRWAKGRIERCFATLPKSMELKRLPGFKQSNETDNGKSFGNSPKEETPNE